MTPNQKLGEAGIAYILQDKSIVPNMTVEENLWMGGFLKNKPLEAKQAAEDALKDKAGQMELAEAQAKLAEAVAQLQAIERMRKKLNR